MKPADRTFIMHKLSVEDHMDAQDCPLWDEAWCLSGALNYGGVWSPIVIAFYDRMDSEKEKRDG